MKRISIDWVVFWIGLFSTISVGIIMHNMHPQPKTPSAEDQCIKNNGVPQYGSGWNGYMTDCKIYITPTKASNK
jgi:hypothetical protein